MTELNNNVHERIKQLCSDGDDAAESADYDSAIGHYQAALRLLPEPVEEWEASTWIFAALGDAFFLKRDYGSALEVLRHAVRCPGGLGNPFIHLRMGECRFELGDAKALDELARAYMGSDGAIFEQEDPKYLQALRSVMKGI